VTLVVTLVVTLIVLFYEGTFSFILFLFLYIVFIILTIYFSLFLYVIIYLSLRQFNGNTKDLLIRNIYCTVVDQLTYIFYILTHNFDIHYTLTVLF